ADVHEDVGGAAVVAGHDGDVDGGAFRADGMWDGGLATDVGVATDDGGNLGEGEDAAAQSEGAEVGGGGAPAGGARLAAHLLLDERDVGGDEDSGEVRITLDACKPLAEGIAQTLGTYDVAPGPIHEVGVHVVAPLLGGIPRGWHRR